MTEKYTPQVGDIVRSQHWYEFDHCEVLDVGREQMLIRRLSDDREWAPLIDQEWVKVEPVKPLADRWYYSVGGGFLGGDRNDGSAAEAMAVCLRRHDTEADAVIHIWTDDDGTDHAKIVRPS